MGPAAESLTRRPRIDHAYARRSEVPDVAGDDSQVVNQRGGGNFKIGVEAV